jgi:alkanesulfonate monooxygenase SsuD/methylene tetrahydromethanopterin reductase-like flavin-dependent oxidoreductase (luciferase family)
MKLGMNIRNWGPTATPEFLSKCARSADNSTLDSIWLNDHLGLPEKFDNVYGIPSDMGDIIDPLGVSNFLAGITERIRFGTGVLVIPYRPALVTCKLITSIQVLSGGRFLLGVGPGYLAEEFTALGVPRTKRGEITDATLKFLREASEKTLHTLHGQDFLVKPKLVLPPIYVGGKAEIAIPRALKYGNGWQPAAGETPAALKAAMETWNNPDNSKSFKKLDIVMMKTLPLEDRNAAIDILCEYKEAGVTEFVHTQGYESTNHYDEVVQLIDTEMRTSIR